MGKPGEFLVDKQQIVIIDSNILMTLQRITLIEQPVIDIKQKVMASLCVGETL